MSKISYKDYYHRKTEKCELIPKHLAGDNGVLYQINSGEITTGMLYSHPKCVFECDMITGSTHGLFTIEKVIFNDPATIVFWADGTKTVVKCGEGDVYDYQIGLLMCIAKKVFGNKGKFNDILREWIPEEEEEETPSLNEIFGFPVSFRVSPDNFSKLVFGGNADA